MNAEPSVAAIGTTPSRPDNRQFARHCASLGLHIFPCGADKKPMPGLKWRKLSTTDAAQIDRWWKQWPDALPAIDLAKSGHIVLDGDRHGGPDGVGAFTDLLAEHGMELRDLPAVITPQDGRHWWFRQRSGEPLGNSEGKLAKQGINVRGHGGYVIAPGAQLPDGRCYTRDKDSPKLFEAIRNKTLPVLP